MKHFDLNRWADFVRNTGSDAERVAMENHLGECTKCQRTVLFLKKLASTAAADTLNVPDFLVHNAKAIFALREPEKVTLSSFVAKLVYDSFREPLPAGVRGQQRMTRQAMYEAGDYVVDLRMEHERGGAFVTLIGQVANRQDPARTVSGLPVMLMSGRDVVARATCNRFGEFQMDYAAGKHIRLHVPVSDAGKWIEVRLHELSKPTQGQEPGSDGGGTEPKD